MNLQVLLILFAFAVGAAVGQHVDRARVIWRAAPAPAAQDYSAQYPCWHARATGHYSQLKGCI